MRSLAIAFFFLLIPCTTRANPECIEGLGDYDIIFLPMESSAGGRSSGIADLAVAIQNPNQWVTLTPVTPKAPSQMPPLKGKVVSLTPDGDIRFKKEGTQAVEVLPRDWFDFARAPVVFHVGTPPTKVSSNESPPPRPLNSASHQRAFAKYYLKGDPKAWADYLEKEKLTPFKRANGDPKGNRGGASHFISEDGRDLATKVYRLSGQEQLDRNLEDLKLQEHWAKQGKGLPILGIGVENLANEFRVTVITENYLSPKNRYGRLERGGDGEELAGLRSCSVAMRTWVRDTMLKQLLSHNDGILPNALYRVTEIDPTKPLPPKGQYYREGNTIAEVVLVDPESETIVPRSIRTRRKEDLKELQIYNQGWQRENMNQQLGL
jgi:hypothetical protein